MSVKTLKVVGDLVAFPIAVVPAYRYTIDGGEPITATVAPFTIEADLAAGSHVVVVELLDTVTGEVLVTAPSSTIVIEADSQLILSPTGVEISA